ncbi:hypothetical protein HK102_010793 [Quaeritorhiza haematococci]|nr:hypothetical protein HK102_010793 [Quaeritorhiza haematococci]
MALRLDVKAFKQWHDKCTHLITPQLKISLKVVQALAKCCWIVTLNWLSQFDNMDRSAFQMPNTEIFLPPLVSEATNYPESTFFPDPRRKTMFSGYTFVVFSEGQYHSLMKIASVTGATVINHPMENETSEGFKSALSKILNPCVIDPEDVYPLPPDQAELLELVLISLDMRAVHENDVAFAVIEVDPNRLHRGRTGAMTIGKLMVETQQTQAVHTQNTSRSNVAPKSTGAPRFDDDFLDSLLNTGASQGLPPPPPLERIEYLIYLIRSILVPEKATPAFTVPTKPASQAHPQSQLKPAPQLSRLTSLSEKLGIDLENSPARMSSSAQRQESQSLIYDSMDASRPGREPEIALPSSSSTASANQTPKTSFLGAVMTEMQTRSRDASPPLFADEDMQMEEDEDDDKRKSGQPVIDVDADAMGFFEEAEPRPVASRNRPTANSHLRVGKRTRVSDADENGDFMDVVPSSAKKKTKTQRSSKKRKANVSEDDEENVPAVSDEDIAPSETPVRRSASHTPRNATPGSVDVSLTSKKKFQSILDDPKSIAYQRRAHYQWRTATKKKGSMDVYFKDDKERQEDDPDDMDVNAYKNLVETEFVDLIAARNSPPTRDAARSIEVGDQEVPPGYAMYQGRLVRNFKHFRKVTKSNYDGTSVPRPSIAKKMIKLHDMIVVGEEGDFVISSLWRPKSKKPKPQKKKKQKSQPAFLKARGRRAKGGLSTDDEIWEDVPELSSDPDDEEDNFVNPDGGDSDDDNDNDHGEIRLNPAAEESSDEDDVRMVMPPTVTRSGRSSSGSASRRVPTRNTSTANSRRVVEMNVDESMEEEAHEEEEGEEEEQPLPLRSSRGRRGNTTATKGKSVKNASDFSRGGGFGGLAGLSTADDDEDDEDDFAKFGRRRR